MEMLTIDGTHVAPILRDDRRRAIEPGLRAADVPVHRWGFASTDQFVITYVHLHNGSVDAATAAKVIEDLGWRNTDICNIDGMLAVTTTP